MNKHLELVREFLSEYSFPVAEQGADQDLAEMEVIIRQALLMEEGSEVFKALKAGDMVEVLLGLVELAYYSLGSIAMQGRDVVDIPVSWQHDGHIISITKLISEKIHNCSDGTTESYSELYAICRILAKRFINADFDKAFLLVHDCDMTNASEGGITIYGSTEKFSKVKPYDEPDLSDCIFE